MISLDSIDSNDFVSLDELLEIIKLAQQMGMTQFHLIGKKQQ